MVTFDATALRAAREAAGLTREDLATRCGMSHRTIENAETGGREPRGTFVAAMARALNVDMVTFYRFDDGAPA